MRYSQTHYVIAVVGFLPEWINRLHRSLKNYSVEVVDAGSIGDGSNASKRATRHCNNADLVLWRIEGARHFPRGTMGQWEIRRVNGVSSAKAAVLEWLGRPAEDAVLAA